MGKYDPLFHYLNSSGEKQITLNFVEIEKILSTKLPNSAYTRHQWWGNHSHDGSQSKSWHDAGYKVDKVFLGDKVIFVKE